LSKSVQNKFLPGVYGSSSQPGTSTPRKLRTWGESGLGAFGEFQRQVNRIFRTETENVVRASPHVIHIEDVFKGLGLDSEAEQKLQRVLEQTRFDFGSDSKLRVPRVVHARIRLMDTMRAMKQIDSTTRMELLRRAMAYWKRNGMDYNQPAVIRYVAKSDGAHAARKTMKHVFLIKGKNPYQAPPADADDDNIQNAPDESPKKKGKGKGKSEVKGDQGDQDEGGQGGPSHPKDRRAKGGGGDFASLPPDQQVQLIQQAVEEGVITEEEGMAALDEIEGGQAIDAPIVSAVEAMTEHEVDGGRLLDFGEEVEAHIPDDADFHHHATEYAKHRAGFQINKDKDPKKADAHKHAANIHASIGNAMHQAGDLERRRLPGSDGSGKAESHEAALAQTEAGAAGMQPDVGEPEDLPMPGGPLGTNGPGGGPPNGNGKAGPPQVSSPRDDIAGGPQPGMPDMERNAPGRDSDLAAAQKMSGKLAMLVGKLTGKQESPRKIPGHKPGRGMPASTSSEFHPRRGDPDQRALYQPPRPRSTFGATRVGRMRGKAGRALTAAEQSVALKDARSAMEPEFPEPMSGKQGPRVPGGARVTHVNPRARDTTATAQRRPPPLPPQRTPETERDRAHRYQKESVRMAQEAMDRQNVPSAPEDRPHPGVRALRREQMEGRANPLLFTMVGKQLRPRSPRPTSTRLARFERPTARTPAEASRRRGEGGLAEVQRRIGWSPEGSRRTTFSGDERAAGRGIAAPTVRQQELRHKPPKSHVRAIELPQINIRGIPAAQLPQVNIRARTRGQSQSRRAAASQAPAAPRTAPTQAQAPAAPQAPAQAPAAQAPAQAPAPARDFRARLDALVSGGAASGARQPAARRSQPAARRNIITAGSLMGRAAEAFSGGFSEKEAMRAARALGIDFGRTKFRFKAFHQGMNHEREHGKVSHAAKTIGQIALDHLREDPRYYVKLARMEKSQRHTLLTTREIRLPYTWK